MPIVERVVQIMTVPEGLQALSGILPEPERTIATGPQILPGAVVIIAPPLTTIITVGAIIAQAAVTTGQDPVAITTRVTGAVVPGVVASLPVEVEVGVRPLSAALPGVGVVPVAVPEEGIKSTTGRSGSIA